MKSLKQIVFVFGGITVIALLISACTSSSGVRRGGQAPLWLTEKDTVYPPDAYLAEVGEGDSLDGAKSAAAAAIAQIFRTRIQVDSTIRTRYREITGEGDESLGLLKQTEVDQSIGQSADESLVNLKYGEAWLDDMGRTYAIAYLDRQETGMLYRQRILENDERIMEILGRAQGQDDPLRRFAFLDAAMVSAEVNRALKEQLEIINMPMARTVIPPYDLGALRAERADQGKALRIRVEVFGDPQGRVGAVLSDWITRRGFTVSDSGDMFLSALTGMAPVKLNNDYENLSWELNLTLLDVYGNPAVSLPASNRSSGVSSSAAEEKAYADIAETITRNFDRAFSTYLNSFLEK